MKTYFLQLLGMAFATCPLFSQNALQLNESSGQDFIMVSAVTTKNTDEQLLMEARSAYNASEVVKSDENETVEADALFVYPNPSKGVIQLKLTGKITVYVYTLSGQFLRKASMPPGEKILDLTGLGTGVFHIMAKSDEDYFSGKLIIQ